LWLATSYVEIVIFVLGDPVDHCANIETGQPTISRTVVEETEIGSMPWQRIGEGESRGQKLTKIVS
jgi:hypothetical protein